MSKLEIVKESLENKLDVVVVKVFENDVFPAKDYEVCQIFSIIVPYSHVVNFYVAPEKENFDQKALQKWMLNLVPELTPDKIEPFYPHIEEFDIFSIGHICFDESLANEKEGTTEEHKRRTIVNVFPSVRLVTDILYNPEGYTVLLNADGSRFHPINTESLERYTDKYKKKGLLKKLFG